MGGSNNKSEQYYDLFNKIINTLTRLDNYGTLSELSEIALVEVHSHQDKKHLKWKNIQNEEIHFINQYNTLIRPIIFEIDDIEIEIHQDVRVDYSGPEKYWIQGIKYNALAVNQLNETQKKDSCYNPSSWTSRWVRVGFEYIKSEDEIKLTKSQVNTINDAIQVVNSAIVMPDWYKKENCERRLRDEVINHVIKKLS